MDIQELKEKMQLLYDELKRETDGKLTPTGVYVPPCAVSYWRKANELIEEVKKYAELDKSFTLWPVLHTLNKEVSFVYNYDGNRKSEKNRNKNWMHLCVRQRISCILICVRL